MRKSRNYHKTNQIKIYKNIDATNVQNSNHQSNDLVQSLQAGRVFLLGLLPSSSRLFPDLVVDTEDELFIYSIKKQNKTSEEIPSVSILSKKAKGNDLRLAHHL